MVGGLQEKSTPHLGPILLTRESESRIASPRDYASQLNNHSLARLR
jgi:hypothetical protein